jgi:hypothetical protein
MFDIIDTEAFDLTSAAYVDPVQALGLPAHEWRSAYAEHVALDRAEFRTYLQER